MTKDNYNALTSFSISKYFDACVVYWRLVFKVVAYSNHDSSQAEVPLHIFYTSFKEQATTRCLA